MREAALAYHLTRKWPKSKILTQYLNSIYFGNGAYGVESAARTYFGNQPDHQDCGTRGHPLCVKSLKPDEAALIAGVVANPTAYDPVAHPQAAKARRNLVLKDMFDQGLLPLRRVPATPASRRSPRPSTSSRPTVRDAGAVLHDLGAPAARRPVRRPARVRGRADGEDDARPRAPGRRRAGGQQVPGQPGGPVGRRRGDRQPDRRGARDGRRARLRRRARSTSPRRASASPGSSIKPFILASALKRGYRRRARCGRRASASSPCPGTRGNEKFVVNNFESKYAGVADARRRPDLLRQLGLLGRWASRSGTKQIAALAERMGIRTPVSSNYAMTLGGLKQGVTPLDMAHAYETFIERRPAHRRHAGRRPTTAPSGSPRSTSPDASTLKHNHATTKQVLERAIADQTVGIMTTVISQGTGRRAALGPGQFAAGKTGTTENSGDAWFVGFTKRWTVAVWVGYADKLKPMLTEFAGAPVEGGTYPRAHLARLHGRGQRDRRRAQRQGARAQGPAAQGARGPDDRRPRRPRSSRPSRRPCPRAATARRPPRSATAPPSERDGRTARRRRRRRHRPAPARRPSRPPRPTHAAARRRRRPAARAPAAGPAPPGRRSAAAQPLRARARPATAATRGGCRARRSASRGRRPS